MMLTGKCKKDFEKWFIKNKDLEIAIDLYIEVDEKYELLKYKYLKFEDLPLSFKYGVYVDFFDSVGMQIYIKPVPGGDINKLGEWSVYIDNFGSHILTDYIKEDTLQEARIKAIQKANEIYDKNNL